MLHILVLLFLWCCQLIGVFGESVSVTEGESVTLNTGVAGKSEGTDILWKYGAERSVIAQIRREEQIFPDGRFRDRLKLDRQTGSLTITNITTQHAGDYKLEISGAKLTTKTFSVSVYARLPVPVIIRNSSSSSSQSNCSVVCSVVNVSSVSLSWYKGNSLLSSISVSDLSISLSLPLEVEYQENNTYSCVINNTISNHTTHLDINTHCRPCEDPPVSVPLLISAVAGSLLLASAVGIFCICRKHRKRDQEGTVQTHEQEIIYAEPAFHKRKAQKLKAEEKDNVVYAPITTR